MRATHARERFAQPGNLTAQQLGELQAAQALQIGDGGLEALHMLQRPTLDDASAKAEAEALMALPLGETPWEAAVRLGRQPHKHDWKETDLKKIWDEVTTVLDKYTIGDDVVPEVRHRLNCSDGLLLSLFVVDITY